MQDIVAALHSRVPAGVLGQAGGVEGELAGGVDDLAQGGANRSLLVQAAHRGADRVALLQKANDAPTADVAGPAGHQHRSLIAHVAPLRDVYGVQIGGVGAKGKSGVR